MRDHTLLSVLPFLADELSKRGGVQILPCTCPPDGPCLGKEDEPSLDPDFVIVIESIGEAMNEPAATDEDLPEFGPAGFELTDDGEEALREYENREAVKQLGSVIDNMVYIVGMYTALVQDKVGG